MAAVSDVLNFARAQAQTDSNGLTDANGLIFANEALLDFRRKLISAGVNAAQLQEAYRDGTLNVGTYLFPTDMFWLKAIELNYTDTTQANYVTATAVDVSNIPGGQSFGWLRTNALITQPMFNTYGDWYEIFPTPTGGNNVSQMIRIFYFLKPTEYGTVNDTIAYPESLDYRIIGWRVASRYLYSLMKTDEGKAFNDEYEEKTRQLTATLARGSEQPVQAVPIQLSGWEF